MKWIFDNPQIIIIALFVIGSLVKNVLESRGGRNQEVDPDGEDERPFVPIDQDKSYRKVQREPSPTPLARHQSGPPPLPSGAAAEAMAREAAAQLKHQQDLAERLRQIRATKAETTGGAAATRARVANKGVAKPLLQSPSSIRSRLRDPAEVRRAFVMREILDPPVGLR